MTTISSPGIGSGLDVNNIVKQLVAIEREPIKLLEQQATAVQSKLSIYGQLQSKLSALRDASSALAQTSTWSQTVGTSSDPAAVAVSTGATTHAGTYAVQVTALAAAQSNATAASYPSVDAAFGEGTLHVELGAWANGAFTANAASPGLDITIGPGAKTLAQVRDAINGANAGITASVLNDASGARLVLRSSATGQTNGFRIGVADSDGNNADAAGLSALAYDPAQGVSTMTLAQAASDAHATIDNLPVTSASNTLSGVIDGMTLSLTRVTTQPVQVDTAADTEAIRKKIEAFVTAYNDVNTLLLEQTRYNEATKVAGALQGDSGAWGLRTQLRNMLGATSAASTMFSRLSDIGFDVKANGSITLDSAKLGNGLTNITEMAKLFANSDALTPQNDGVATRLRQLTGTMLEFDGAVQSRTEALQHKLDLNQDKQDRLEERVARTEARLRAQYAALDIQMNRLSGLSSYVQQQIANWNKKTE